MCKMNFRTAAAFLVLFLCMATAGWSMEVNDAGALSGLKTGKGIFLLSTDNPEMAAFYLEGIKATHQTMREQGVEPDFILVIIGQAVRFLSSEFENSADFAKTVKDLDKAGVKMEICAFAVDYFKVPRQSIFPELKLVADGWNSLIGYQNKGYGFVPSF